MHLRSGIPFWSAKNGLLAHHDRLITHAHCEIAVMGAGITGAIIAHALAQRGHDVRVLEAVETGWGDTAACMAMMSGDPGQPLIDLAALHGETIAMRMFHACAAAIEALTASTGAAMATLGETTIDLRHAGRGRDCRPLRREFEFRRKMRLEVEWLERDELDARYGLQARCAMLGRPAAAIDPYLATHALLEAACRAGAHVHARTHVVRIHRDHRGVRLETSRGLRVHARHLVLATGPAAEALLPAPVGSRRIGCVLVSDALDAGSLERIRPLLIRDASRHGLSMRTTPDGRVMIGGDHHVHAHADAPQRDAGIGVCARSLLRKARRRLPAIDLEPAFGWAGSYIASDDGLPYFGTHALTGPRIHYAMAYGDNGIAFSSIGADIIADAIRGRTHPLASLLDFSRLYGIAA